jgi:transposase
LTDGELGELYTMQSMPQAPVKVRRKFAETFKREALHNWLNSGKSATVIARELGLKANRLYAWKQTFAPAAAGGEAAAGAKPATVAELQTQLAAARREIARIAEQRDILKKTLAILSEASPNAMNGFTR